MRLRSLQASAYLAVILALFCVPLPIAVAQRSASPRPAFDTATIKPTDPTLAGKYDVGMVFSTGTFTARRQTLRDLIKFAFNIKSEDQLSGGPNWIDTDRFDIEARIDPALLPRMQTLSAAQRTDEFRPLVQSLLADRFQLKTTDSVQQLPVFALILSRNGPKLKETTPAPAGQPPLQEVLKGDGGRLVANAASPQTLARFLSHQPELRSRMVVDRTSLKGAYTFTLVWTPESASASPSAEAEIAAAASAAPSLFTAWRNSSV